MLVWVLLLIISAILMIVATVMNIHDILDNVRTAKKRHHYEDKLLSIICKTYMFDVEDVGDKYTKGWNDAVEKIYKELIGSGE